MVKENGRLMLECKEVHETKRYRKYKFPEELFEDEERVVMFSGKHVYLHKGDDGDGVKEVVIVLGSEEKEGKVSEEV